MSEETPEQPATPGWWVAHLFYAVTDRAERGPIEVAVKECVADGHQVVSVALLGHRGDLGLMVIGPDAGRIRRLQTQLRRAGLELVGSYLSLTEVSEYATGLPPAMLEARLRPQLPPEGLTAYCFYPMSKRRGEEANWFLLPYDDRLALMHAHGTSGRKFRGRVLQLVTGSTGLDDFEWGVTLFAQTPDDLKACVYTMRFDEASARYAEFGPFVVGTVGSLDGVLDAVGIG